MVTHTTITLDLLNGYLSCKYKAYLRLPGNMASSLITKPR